MLVIKAIREIDGNVTAGDSRPSAFTWEAGIDGEAGNLLIKISGDLTEPIDWRVGACSVCGAQINFVPRLSNHCARCNPLTSFVNRVDDRHGCL